ncbi:hypothetical protein [Bradyrhizobium vignae]|uniref:hypothetical protein n=1 Tax=Bradyrhizobium vignae TaxID=1549949 RepID=UPI00100A570C|nr:hypothetical protein [Bradyrhizobium vignae]RXG87670.1 hypothetical protein EAV90_31945 [Bradyrhizobium vignae]
MVLGDGDAEHRHDDQDKSRRAPLAPSGRALRLSASRAERKTDWDFVLAELADHQRLDAYSAAQASVAPNELQSRRTAASRGCRPAEFRTVNAEGETSFRSPQSALTKSSQEKTPRFRARLFSPTALGFQPGRQHGRNLKLKCQKATAPQRRSMFVWRRCRVTGR